MFTQQWTTTPYATTDRGQYRENFDLDYMPAGEAEKSDNLGDEGPQEPQTIMKGKTTEEGKSPYCRQSAARGTTSETWKTTYPFTLAWLNRLSQLARPWTTRLENWLEKD